MRRRCCCRRSRISFTADCCASFRSRFLLKPSTCSSTLGVLYRRRPGRSGFGALGAWPRAGALGKRTDKDKARSKNAPPQPFFNFATVVMPARPWLAHPSLAKRGCPASGSRRPFQYLPCLRDSLPVVSRKWDIIKTMHRPRCHAGRSPAGGGYRPNGATCLQLLSTRREECFRIHANGLGLFLLTSQPRPRGEPASRMTGPLAPSASINTRRQARGLVNKESSSFGFTSTFCMTILWVSRYPSTAVSRINGIMTPCTDRKSRW